ncbi:MAG TPA: hypothetical protein VIQ30_00290 [Pseudonocardia sp.]
MTAINPAPIQPGDSVRDTTKDRTGTVVNIWPFRGTRMVAIRTTTNGKTWTAPALLDDLVRL